jgi:hypothetical protein
MVGVSGVGLYLAAALVPTFFRELRMTDLVLANSIQLTGHALVMLWLAGRIGSLRGRGLGRTALKALAASLVMGGLAFASAQWLLARFPNQALLSEVMVVGGAGLVGLLAYGALVRLLRIEEVTMLTVLLRRRLGRLGGW